jgi:hypothetical protein
MTEKTLFSVRISRNTKRNLIELAQAAMIVGAVGFAAGMFWAIKSCMGVP